tara:strand:+ start:729 stop:1130 length:402 start_codon:yes stop_codon:yes gene_type:complete
MSALWLVTLGAGLTYNIQKRGMNLLDSTVLDAKENELRDEQAPDEHIPSKKIRKLQSLPHHNSGSGDTDLVNPDLAIKDIEDIKHLATLRKLQMQNGIVPAEKMRGNDKVQKSHSEVEVTGIEWNGEKEAKWC